MAIVVIGGQARKVGKTSVVAGLIAALVEYHWTAVKVSQHPHDLSRAEWPGWVITEEHDRSGASDTSRFLAAGAARALWVRAYPGYLRAVIPELQRKIPIAQNVIIESNSAMRFLRPEVCLLVLDPGNPDFKESARELLPMADGIICRERAATVEWTSKPVFVVRPPSYVTLEMVEFVRARIAQPSTNRGSTGGAKAPS